MPRQTPVAAIFLALSVASGCSLFQKNPADKCRDAEFGVDRTAGGNQPCLRPASGDGTAECDGPTIRVKAPPQKIVIEQQPCPTPQPPPAPAPAPKKESAPESSESQPEKAPAKPEAAPAPSTARPESFAGTVAGISQIAGLVQSTAMTSPLGTVTPGASALGIGIRWIHIPIPVPRLFSVQETPSITVPLSEANLVSYGYGAGLPNVAGAAGIAPRPRPVSREELSEMIAQEIADERAQRPARKQETATAASKSKDDDAERQHLEKKLADAEAQIDRLSKILKSLDDKLPATKPAASTNGSTKP